MEEPSNSRRILIAVDDSENARRAVRYAADLLGGAPGFKATVLTVVPEPPGDYFRADAERQAWLEERKAAAGALLEECRGVLIRSGFAGGDVAAVAEVGPCPSVADCVLAVQRRLGSGTVVVGRRGVSKKEEFLFGSTSSRIMHSVKDCAVWVVE
jgi:nucleotide-binding universal stress UspA family protein